VRRVYIGIDYSDARSPTSRLRGLQVFEATVDEAPQKIETPAPVRFWPFDGFDVPQGQPLVAERSIPPCFDAATPARVAARTSTMPGRSPPGCGSSIIGDPGAAPGSTADPRRT
jgi:hypothetical protein